MLLPWFPPSSLTLLLCLLLLFSVVSTKCLVCPGPPLLPLRLMHSTTKLRHSADVELYQIIHKRSSCKGTWKGKSITYMCQNLFWSISVCTHQQISGGERQRRFKKFASMFSCNQLVNTHLTIYICPWWIQFLLNFLITQQSLWKTLHVQCPKTYLALSFSPRVKTDFENNTFRCEVWIMCQTHWVCFAKKAGTVCKESRKSVLTKLCFSKTHVYLKCLSLISHLNPVFCD